MPRYIDKDKAIALLRNDCVIRFPETYRAGITASSNAIATMPIEDVVPRSEVEYYIKIMFEVELIKAKQEVAREIFEEIESKFHEDDFGDLVIDFMEFQELKKKYIGE